MVGMAHQGGGSFLTMIYQDLFRKSRLGGKLCCMTRPNGYRFVHGVNFQTLDLIGGQGQVQPGELTCRLTVRAIYFHSVLTEFRGPKSA